MRRKILHVLGAMNRGGVETWLMQILRAIDRSQFQFHFMVHTDREATYDREILSLGGHIHHCPARNPIKYRQQFRTVLAQHGPFDVVHSHVYLYNGFLMRLAAEAGIPVRIAHSHTAPKPRRFNLGRTAYEQLMRQWILRYSTHRIGISNAAAAGLFGKHDGANALVLYYGLDFRRFFDRPARREAKKRLGIPESRKVIGHVGRFSPVKNHGFLVATLDQVVSFGTDAHLLLVGQGSMLAAVKKDVHARGLSDRCTFTGEQNDVVPFLSAMDIFVLPSSYEGLGIVALEAQAAGLPVIASTAVPQEVDVIPNSVEHLSLTEGASRWASRIVEKLHMANISRGDEPLLLQTSRFAMPTCIERLTRIYLGEDMKELAA